MVSPAKPGDLYEKGEPVTVEAVPAAGFAFDRWEGQAKDATGNIALVVMDTDKTLTAFFIPSSSCCSLLVTVATPGSGTVALSPAQPADGYAVGDNVRLTAEAAPGYLFSHWEAGLKGSATPALISITGNQSVTAVFNPTVEVARDPSQGGTVTLEPEQPPDGYPAGTEVTAGAIAAEGYRFDQWSGDLSGSETQQTFFVDGPMTMTANFASQKSFPWKWVGVGMAGFLLAILLAVYFRAEILKG